MASVSSLGNTFNTTSGTHTVTATPAVNDLIVIIVANTGSTASVAPTDNNSDGNGSYTKITSAVKNSSGDTMEVYVRNSLVGSASSTVFTHAPGTTSGGGLIVFKISGMSVAGLSAIRQSAIQSNQSSGGTPTPVFTNAVVSNNPVIGAVFNATNPATMTPRSSPSYTEQADVGYATPTTGFEAISVNSGETATSIAWGGTSGSAFCSLVVELAYNTSPTVALNSPANSGSVNTVSPQLQSTGTDADSDTISYQYQVDSVNTFDSVAAIAQYQAVTSNNSTLTLSHTVPSNLNNKVLVVALVMDNSTNPTVNSVTFNGVSMTLAQLGSHTSGFKRADIYYLVNPPDGTFNVVANITNPGNYSIAAMTLSDVDQSNPIDTSGTAGGNTTTPSLSITTTNNGSIIIDAISSDGVGNPTGTNQVQKWTQSYSFNRARGSVTTTGTAGSQTLSYATNAGNYSLTAVAFKRASYPMINRYSNNDAGFTDITNGADTDPFNSGDQIGFTIPNSASTIAIDSVSSGRNSSGGPLTVSHTTGSGVNRMLIVITTAQDSNHTNMPVAEITANGIQLTKLRSDEATGNNRSEIWYLINPPVGTYNIVANTIGALGEFTVGVISLTGVKQSAPEASAGATGNGPTPQITLTTVANNAFTITVATSEASFSSINNSQTGLSGYPLTDQSYENADGASRTVSSPGATTLSYTTSSGQSWAMSGVSLAPAGLDGLTNGSTYYWRVRAKDPSGTNGYGAWATTRSFTVNLATPISVSDSGSGSEAAGILVTGSLAETGTGTDTQTILAQQSASDTGSGSDSPSVVDVSSIAVNVSDNGTGSENEVTFPMVPLSDSGSETDSTSISTQVPLTDSVAGSDAPNIASSLNTSDTGSGTDASSVASTVNGSDSGSGNDAQSTAANIGLSDSGSETDAMTSIGATVPLNDTGAGSESTSISNSFNLSESGSEGDTAIISSQFSLSDSGSFSELIQVFQTAISINDTGTALDSLDSLLAMLSLADAGSGIDAKSIFATLDIQETGSLTDLINLFTQLSTSDTGSESDSVSSVISVNSTDSGSGSDSMTGINAAIPVNESGTAIDSLSAFISLALSEIGSGTDIFSILAQANISDTASATDIISSLLGVAILSDVATGVEQLSIFASLVLSDLANGSDATSIFSKFTLTDTGSTADVLSIANFITTADSANANEAISLMVNVLINDVAIISDFIYFSFQLFLNDNAVVDDVAFGSFAVLVHEFGVATETLIAGYAFGLYLRGQKLYNKGSKLYNRNPVPLYNKR